MALILIVLGVLAVPKFVQSNEPRPGGGGPGGRGGTRSDTLRVDGYVVGPQELTNRIFTTGQVRANESVELASESSGRLVAIRFDEGKPVRQGQLVVKINDADLQAQRARALHRLNLAEKREQRQKLILEQGGISQEEYDMTLSELNVLRAEIEVINAQIAKTEIHAPFSGVIGLRYVSEGAYVSPQTKIATLQSLNPVKIDFSVPEKYAGSVQVGGSIQFRVQGSPAVYQARIYAVEPQISRNTRTLQLRALASNPGGRLMPGAFADVELILDRIESALAVPTISVIPELDQKKVFVYKAGRAEPRVVETGIRTESEVQILNGLAAGDTVLTSGMQQLRPGAPVRIVQMAGESAADRDEETASEPVRRAEPM